MKSIKIFVLNSSKFHSTFTMYLKKKNSHFKVYDGDTCYMLVCVCERNLILILGCYDNIKLN